MTAVVQEKIINRDTLFSESVEVVYAPEIGNAAVEYPDSDGLPMGETEFHVIATMRLYEALGQFFLNRDDVYVAADMFLYYEEGNRFANKSPDVMVITGVDKYARRTFKIWEEKASPCVIFEITSKSTMKDDMVTKRALYSDLGVREYFLFDPLGEYLEKPLLGFRLQHHEYVAIVPDKAGCLFSEELEVLLCGENAILRVIVPQTKQAIPSLAEAVSLAVQEAQRAEQEAQRAEQEAQRAEQEAQRAEQEAQRAEQEAQRAERLAAQLRAMGIEPEA